VIDEITTLGIGMIGFVLGIVGYMIIDIVFRMRKMNKKHKKREAEHELQDKIRSVCIAEIRKAKERE